MINTEDAKLILAAVHQGDEPDSDTEEAFALLESTPELQRWFQQEQAFDNAISGKLAEIEPPAALKTNLIKLLRDAQRGEDPGPAPEPKNVTWFRPPFLAAAAAVILIPLIAIQLFTGRANAKSFDSFRNDMIEFAGGKFELDHIGNELPGLYQWLNENNATCPTELSASVSIKSSIGCRVIDWNDESVTLICLRNDTDQVVHCFVLPREELNNLPDESLMGIPIKQGELETCCWTDENFLYLLVGSGKDVKLPMPKRVINIP